MKKTAVTKITTEDYLYALGQLNLVYNYDFRYFSNRDGNNYGTPDGWVHTDTGKNGKINYNTEIQLVEITKSEGDESMTFTQALHEFPKWQQMLLGETVTGKVVLDTDKDGAVNVILSDGITSSTATTLTKGASILDFQLNINDIAQKLTLTIESEVPFMVIHVASCNVNIGEISIKNLPCVVRGIIGERKQYIATENPPAEELSLCSAGIALTENQTRLNSVLNGRFGKNDSGYSLLLDMRGYFSRAWDNGATIDPDAKDRTVPGKGTLTGDHVSTFEQDAFEKHVHGLNFTVGSTQSTTGGVGPNTNLVNPVTSYTNSSFDDKKKALEGKETRPKNIYELYTIKWA